MSVVHTLLLAWYLVMFVLTFASAVKGTASKTISAIVAVIWPVSLAYGLYQGLDK